MKYWKMLTRKNSKGRNPYRKNNSRKIFDCLKGCQKHLQRLMQNTNISMKKIENIKAFLEVEELSKLEQGAVQGGAAEAKQKIRQKNDKDGTITQENN